MGDPVQPTKLISQHQIPIHYFDGVMSYAGRLTVISPIWAIISLLCQFFKVARLWVILTYFQIFVFLGRPRSFRFKWSRRVAWQTGKYFPGNKDAACGIQVALRYVSHEENEWQQVTFGISGYPTYEYNLTTGEASLPEQLSILSP